MLIEEILYNHVNTTLEVKLKPIFEALRRIKESYDENVRTLKTLIIPIKKHPKVLILIMGRIVGFEPTHIGTTIRGLDHLTISAMNFNKLSIPNKYFYASKKIKLLYKKGALF